METHQINQGLSNEKERIFVDWSGHSDPVCTIDRQSYLLEPHWTGLCRQAAGRSHKRHDVISVHHKT